MKPGYASLEDYAIHLSSDAFAGIERASRDFLETNRIVLEPYARRWAPDPLHQWSRAWEYPFTSYWLERLLGSGARRVLDAGSGATFFPFHLAAAHPGLQVVCVDQDANLAGIFSSLRHPAADRVRFNARPLDQTGLPDAAFDAIYCISVLEHTPNHAEIAAEFRRLLKPAGHLIVTLDVSLDGRAEIPLPRLRDLLAALARRFEPVAGPPLAAIGALDSAGAAGIVTTEAVRGEQPQWLPWRYPRLSGALAALKLGAWPRFAIKRLTFACLVLQALP